jgi:hypothetical protein
MNKSEVLYKGIRLVSSGKYEALYSGKYLGTFDTKDEAAAFHHKFKEQKEREYLAKRTNKLPIGVKILASGNYCAMYAHKYLGSFDTPEKAKEAYDNEKKKKIQTKLDIQNKIYKTKELVQTEEEWKPIPGFSRYEVSNDGLIMNIESGEILTDKPRAGGYVTKQLTNDDGKSKTVNVHWCVCIAFHGDPPTDNHTIDHINKIRHDNRELNLKWATESEQNLNQNKTTDLKRYTLLQIDPETNEVVGEYISIEDANKKTKLKITSSIIKAIKIESEYKGFIWKYKDCEDLEDEIWKKIEKEGKEIYVSNHGRIKDLKNREIHPNKMSNGYLRIAMNSKQQLVHRLVAQAFLENPNDLQMVNHKDSDKTNNKLENLEWISHSDNITHSWKNNPEKYGYMKKVDKVDKNGNIIESYRSIAEACRKNNLKSSHRSLPLKINENETLIFKN